MKISRRKKDGWTDGVENKSKTHCDKCGEKLWTTPPPAKIYCNGGGIDGECKGKP